MTRIPDQANDGDGFSQAARGAIASRPLFWGNLWGAQNPTHGDPGSRHPRMIGRHPHRAGRRYYRAHHRHKAPSPWRTK